MLLKELRISAAICCFAATLVLAMPPGASARGGHFGGGSHFDGGHFGGGAHFGGGHWGGGHVSGGHWVVVTSMEATSAAGEAGSAGASALASCLDLERPTTGIIRITPIMETASCKGGG
jgi:hypothetical protein